MVFRGSTAVYKLKNTEKLRKVIFNKKRILLPKSFIFIHTHDDNNLKWNFFFSNSKLCSFNALYRNSDCENKTCATISL
ncbi:hypothetical protein T01_5851, partial [Trichinella spiralis]